MRDAAIEKVLDPHGELLEGENHTTRGSGTRRRGRGIAIGFKGVHC